MTQRRRGQQSKFWVFTVNDQPEVFRLALEYLFQEKSPHISYICGQLEEAAHRHFQGYVQLKTSRALSWLKNNISGTAHFEIQRGTSEQARDYCHKADATTVADTFVEFGEYRKVGSGAGERTDITALRDAIVRGSTQKEIIENDELVETFAKYMRFHDRVKSLYKPPARENGVHLILLVGAPGTGKTRRAFEQYPDLFEIPISNGTMWMDGYDDQPHVLFDDFMGKGSKMTLDNTLKFFDRYVRQVPIKGAYVWYRPEVIIVTTNYHPRYWYEWKGREESWKALKRRIHEIWWFPELGEAEEQHVDLFLDDVSQWPAEQQGEPVNQYD